jgi:folate-binding protein YgfZ
MNAFDATVDRERLARLRLGAVVVDDEPAVFEVIGPGALDCLQGLLTNDLVGPGDDSLVYGAFLTPKGMIVVDAWVVRRSGVFTAIVPAGARTTALDLFRRSLPPRLARVTDRTTNIRVAWLYGHDAPGAWRNRGASPWPEAPGRVTETSIEGVSLLLGRPGLAAPFTGLLLGSGEAIATAAAALARAGAAGGDATDQLAARVIAGWPAWGAEIDDKTLPQEVRYEEIDGVSYTKGCYTGQETVARVHFRGHPNRVLRGLLWHGAGGAVGAEISAESGESGGAKPVGTVRSIVRLPDRALALAVLRREVAPGSRVSIGGLEAEVVSLPFADEHLTG